MAGFLQTLQRRVAGRVLVYSNLGTTMVRGTASHGGVDVGMEWIILAGKWADCWTSVESEFD